MHERETGVRDTLVLDAHASTARAARDEVEIPMSPPLVRMKRITPDARERPGGCQRTATNEKGRIPSWYAPFGWCEGASLSMPA
jgi:hypothetical protein